MYGSSASFGYGKGGTVKATGFSFKLRCDSKSGRFQPELDYGLHSPPQVIRRQQCCRSQETFGDPWNPYTPVGAGTCPRIITPPPPPLNRALYSLLAQPGNPGTSSYHQPPRAREAIPQRKFLCSNTTLQPQPPRAGGAADNPPPLIIHFPSCDARKRPSGRLRNRSFRRLPKLP